MGVWGIDAAPVTCYICLESNYENYMFIIEIWNLWEKYKGKTLTAYIYISEIYVIFYDITYIFKILIFLPFLCFSY